MPGALNHSPAHVLSRWMIAAGLTTLLSEGEDWPVCIAQEPDSPDDVVTMYDTEGRSSGRTFDGERQEHHGVQVRVRSALFTEGYAKARAIAVALDQLIDETLGVGNNNYLIRSASRTSDVLHIGKDAPSGTRSLFTVNVLLSLRKLPL